ncbi:hypothetical protein CHS0354_037508 [Potamilus streckersoni]|uniref:Uncharacterized protein n=1 Tax=Potamilus streckersoni TaxID=2493646 RepID=A0AAE0VHS1_9BIVA|nr:hypothetical protein CHS0354_037508 [Potamilus streckersoni]
MNRMIFVMADIMMQQVKIYYEQIKEKFDETETVTINLEIDPQIQGILSQSSGIGRVICKKELEKVPKSRVEKPLKECKLEMTKAVEIKGPDGKNPWYTGFTFLQEDHVLLADYNNKRVLLLNSSYQCIVSLTLPDSPWDICVVDHKEVAVSLPLQKTLQFLSITNGFMRSTRTVETRYECRGIASKGRGKIVLSGSCKDKGKHYWSLINSTGLEEKCYQFDCQCDPSLTYIALNSLCTRVYITVSQAHSLYCFDMDGKRLFVYRNDSLKFSQGVATDRDDNVYVLGMLSYNIHQLTPGGTPIRIYTERIPEFPYAICFNSCRDKFALTNNSIQDDGNKLYMYRFK